MAVKDIDIVINAVGNIEVTPYAVDLSVGNGDTVKWKSSQGHDFVVCFGQESPFDKKHFFRGRGASGAIKAGVVLEKYYKYTIETAGLTLDPGIIVRP